MSTLQVLFIVLLGTFFTKVIPVLGDCLPGEVSIAQLLEGTTEFGERPIAVRASLLPGTASISCPLEVYVDDYVDTTDNFLPIRIHQVFKGSDMLNVDDKITTVWGTDTGYWQYIPDDLSSAESFFAVMGPVQGCSGNYQVDPENTYYLSECDQYAGGIMPWDQVSEADRAYLQSLIEGEVPTQPSTTDKNPFNRLLWEIYAWFLDQVSSLLSYLATWNIFTLIR